MMNRLYLVFTLSMLIGCSTTGHFKVPEGSNLYIDERPTSVDVKANGEVTTKPFFWRAFGTSPDGGIPYRLEQNGQVLKEGKLSAKFRIESLFWPPAAMFYWPIGFNHDITYDLINDTQE